MPILPQNLGLTTHERSFDLVVSMSFHRVFGFNDK